MARFFNGYSLSCKLKITVSVLPSAAFLSIKDAICGCKSWLLRAGSRCLTWKVLFFIKKDETILWQTTRYSSSERFTPTIVPVDICRALCSDRVQPHCLHPCLSAAGSLLRRSVFALSDVGYALWNPGHHALQ